METASPSLQSLSPVIPAPVRTLEMRDIHKSYRTYKGRKHVLRGINFSVPSNINLGILGRNGAGKSTLMQILCGLERPDSGQIINPGLRLSWPIGRGGVQSAMTGRDNVRFICRAYALDYREIMEFVQEFTELGEYIDMPVDTYSAGMKARLGFAVSMAAQYDCYLVDEGFNAGDARFTQRMSDMFEQRRANANMIVVSHNGSVIRKFCDKAAVLEKGHLTMYDSVEEALKHYTSL